MDASRRTALAERRGARYGRAQNGRIQKLLLSEYCEFSERVLVETPFAETTRNGRGLRQVALGLTPTRLIVAADILRTNPGFLCPSGLDPSIESFELVSLYPLEYVTLSVFRRRHRRTLKARFVDGRARFYELGGVQRRILWRLWCEQVQRLLARKRDGSSLSETTAASSSSSSSSSSALYLLSSEIEVGRNREGRCKKPIFRIWTRYGGAGDYVPPTWTEKGLYLGASFNELVNGHYAPVPVRFAGASLDELRNELIDRASAHIVHGRSCRSWPCERYVDRTKSQRAGELCDVLFVRNHRRDHRAAAPCCSVCQLDNSVGASIAHSLCYECRRREEEERQQRKGTPLTSKVSRFGFGVPEKCSSGLVLGPYRGPGRDPAHYIEPRYAPYRTVQPYKMLESGVTIWEGGRTPKSRGHPRRYGFSSAPHFFHALGPWSVQPGERDSVQALRSLSAVNIRRQPADPEMRFSVSRRQLTASVSCAALTSDGSCPAASVTRGRVMLFWTPEYWYRPQAAAVAYRELRRHLASLQSFRREKEKRTKRKFFRRRKDIVISEETSEATIADRSSSLLERVLSMNVVRKRGQREANENTGIDRGTAQLRRLLRMNIRITVWDLDSATIATQLTMIDRDLFVRIPATEIELLIHQRSSRNAPNLGAWIAFSHRIACLTVSEILAVKKLDMRTRIMARFINAADKCLALGNFQSCRSILAGLQAPPIYRLRASWCYLRTHHASRYELMEKLSRIYSSPSCSRYRRAWAAATRSPFCMPYVGHFLIKVLDTNDSRETRRNLASCSGRRQRIKRTVSITESPSDLNALAKMRFTVRRSVVGENDAFWTRRQRYLARKFLDRWKVIAFEARMRDEDDEEWRNVDPRRKHVLDVATWLTDCQRSARNYSFALHSFACEFLLKARYREDRENFFISLKLEPPGTMRT